MFSRFLGEFSAWKCLFTLTFLGVTGLLSHFVLKRRRLSRSLPGSKIALLSFLGDISNFPRGVTKNLSGTSAVTTLQTLSGYALLHRREKFFTFWLAFTPSIIIVKAEAAQELISGMKNLDKGWVVEWLKPLLGTGLVTSGPEKWRSRRKLIEPAFHFDILRDFLPVMDEQSRILVSVLGKETREEWTDIIEPVNLCTLDIVYETIIGVHIYAQKKCNVELVEAFEKVGLILLQRPTNILYLNDWTFYLTRMGRDFKKTLELINSKTLSAIRDKKTELLLKRRSLDGKEDKPGKRKALMDLLLDHHVIRGTLTEQDMLEEINTFIYGGSDTPAMAMCWSLYLIGLYKDVQSAIHEEMDRIFGKDAERPVTMADINHMEYLDRVLKESKRLYPPGSVLVRKCSEETVLNGHKIAAGTACSLFVYEIHRDPDVFPNPEKFDPDRFLPENAAKRHPYAYIPFSAGCRNCIGQRFAVIEEKIVIANLLRNYTVESLEPRDKVLPALGMILRPAGPLKLKIRHRER